MKQACPRWFPRRKNPGGGGQREDLRRLGGEDSPDRTEVRTKRMRIARTDVPEEGIELTLSDRRKPQGRRINRRGSPGSAEVAPRSGRIEGEGLPSSFDVKTAPPPETEGANIRVIELGSDSPSREGSQRTAEGNPTAAPSFSEILKEKGIGQLVKQTGILLKDDNRGEIKLILKPEALGKVRIRLNLEDSRIVGRILVETSSVKEAFSQNLEELQRSLRESGFESAHLEVSVEGESFRQDPGQNRRPLRNRRQIVEAVEESLPRTIALKGEEPLVNLIA